MKEIKYYYFARDKRSGTCSLWNSDIEKPTLNSNGNWDDTVFPSGFISDSQEFIRRLTGGGCFGIRKGQCKKIKITKEVEVV